MQRAAASAPPSTPPSNAQPPDTHTPPSKRRKTDADTPGSGNAAQSDIQRIQIALDEEQAKREKAIERLAEEAGETKWVFSTVGRGSQGGGEGAGAREGTGGLKVLRAGYSEIDSEAWRSVGEGRRSFGRFNREMEV